MSDTQASDTVAISSDGVTVTKRFEADEFPVPAIAFVFESSRDLPVSVRLTDAVPEDVDVGDLGFHPEYGSEYWSLDDDRIVFEYELSANAEYTTVYGLRATGTDDVQRFLTEPALESVEPPLEGDVTEDPKSGESGEAAATDENAATDKGGSSSPNETGISDEQSGEEPDASDAPSDEGSQDASTSSDEDVASSERPGGSDTTVGSLADELRNGDVSQDDVRILREALDAADEGSTVARLRKLQADVDDILAYKDTLEEFLDETGSGEVIEDFQDDLGAHQQAIDGLQETTETLRDDMSTVIKHVDSVEASVDELEERLDELETQLEDVQDSIEGGQLTDRVDDLETWREQLSTALGEE